MRVLIVLLLCISSALAQPARRAAPDAGANLPSQSVGPNDLISVSVYDAPELSRTIRVGADGYFALPMLKQRIKAKGLFPEDHPLSLGVYGYGGSADAKAPAAAASAAPRL